MLLENMKQCCGCGACSVICPKSCITMEADQEGFLYPSIDQDACISCGLCERVCPVIHQPDVSDQTRALAVKNNDLSVRMNSSSGGVFSILAEYVLEKGGSVYGAAYNHEYAVHHIGIDKPEQLGKLRGAKYSQSTAFEHFQTVKAQLNRGVYILFAGTPCQTAALKQYLGKDYENLILVDMICHGVPSPLVWKKYLEERNQKDAPDSNISFINQRSKVTGWSRYSYSVEITYDKGKIYSVRQGEDPFMQGFVQNLYLRPSCSECVFKGYERCSDFTLGDCWGIWDILPEMDDDQGTSLLLIHSEKAERIWKSLSEQCKTHVLTKKEALAQNPSALHASAPHRNRDRFFDEIHNSPDVIRSIQNCLQPQKESRWKGLLARIRRK